MPEISTAGIFQVAFIARQMEQTPRAFFQTTFEPIGRVCAARHARGGWGYRENGECVRTAHALHAGYGLLRADSKNKPSDFRRHLVGWVGKPNV